MARKINLSPLVFVPFGFSLTGKKIRSRYGNSGF